MRISKKPSRTLEFVIASASEAMHRATRVDCFIASLLAMTSLSQAQIRYVAAPEPVQKMHLRLLKKIAPEVARLEAAIADLVKATPHLTELAEIIETVPGLGAITSASG